MHTKVTFYKSTPNVCSTFFILVGGALIYYHLLLLIEKANATKNNVEICRK